MSFKIRVLDNQCVMIAMNCGVPRIENTPYDLATAIRLTDYMETTLPW